MLPLIFAVLLQAPPQTQVPGYTRTEAMIPMRDGVKLHAVIQAPQSGAAAKLPILLHRTPYGAGFADFMARRIGDFGLEGYILVGQDIRGRFESEGTFDMNRPPKTGRNGVDESTDAWDTIDWLVKHVANNNGRVGTIGVSYPGWLTAVTGIGAHPALKAVSPQAPMGDTWMGDDFFHQGAFRLSYGTEYAWSMESSKDQSEDPSPSRYDVFEWYLSFPTLDSLARAVRAERWPSWKRFSEHPAYDTAWQRRCLPCYMRHAIVPTLVVGGWWDQEDEYGPLAHYKALQATDSAGLVHLVMGPWYHGQWTLDSGMALGNARFGRPTGVEYRAFQTRFFDYYLKGKGDGTFPEAWLFDAGASEWKSFAKWPPANAQKRKLYFQSSGRLSFDPPAEAQAADSFVSDPARPVPYRPRPVELTYGRGSRWRRWETEDQRFVDGRPDVLTWQTGPLTTDVTIAGDVVARLQASTSGSDADWVVKLIDVYPDSVAGRPDFGGYELMVTGEIMRGRYYKSWSTPEAIPANQVTAFTVDLHQQAYTFKRGHRIMVQLQSTWFPLYDRNPQTFVPNIFKAQASDYRAQTHRVYRSAQQPSYVEVDAIP